LTQATITVSRQAGARGRSLARLLAERLNQRQGPDSVPWTVFDRELMERVLSDHNLPPRLATFFPEARWNEIDSTINTLLKRHPDNWTIFEHTVDTVRKLVARGHAILVGRGANFVTRECPHALHVRLIGSKAKRIDHLAASRGWSENEAKIYLEREDRNRRAFVRQHFEAEVDDPGAHSLVLNTDHLSNARMVDLLIAWVDSCERGTDR